MANPNILMIVCDQLRYDSVGFSGMNPVKTPNIDKLASQGVWFEKAFTSIPTCCPARQSMLAGKRAESFGAHWNYDNTICIPSLMPTQPTWSKAVKEAGYNTGYYGKWHVNPDYDPTYFGYDDFYSEYTYFDMRRDEYQDYPYPRSKMLCGVDPIPLELSKTHYVANKAIAAMENFAKQPEPWHVRIDFSDPHLPCYVCKEFYDLYDAKEIPEWPSFKDKFENKPYIQRQNIVSWGLENATWEDWAEYVACYYGVISQIDDAVGKVMAALEATGQADNTIVIFTADHGDMAGSHRMMDKHYILYDDVVRVPLIVRWPGKAEGVRYDGFISNCLDMAPTMLDIVNTPEDKRFDMDGISFFPLITEGAMPEKRTDIVTSYNGQQFGLYTQRMLRNDHYKYVWNMTDTDEFYDMVNDPWEMNNLIAEPSVQGEIAAMRKRLYEILLKEDEKLVRPGWIARQLLAGHKLLKDEMI